MTFYAYNFQWIPLHHHQEQQHNILGEDCG